MRFARKKGGKKAKEQKEVCEKKNKNNENFSIKTKIFLNKNSRKAKLKYAFFVSRRKTLLKQKKQLKFLNGKKFHFLKRNPFFSIFFESKKEKNFQFHKNFAILLDYNLKDLQLYINDFQVKNV